MLNRKPLISWLKDQDLPQEVKDATEGLLTEEICNQIEGFKFSQGNPALPPSLREDEWWVTLGYSPTVSVHHQLTGELK